jgi:positive regulator of sigma E activity
VAAVDPAGRLQLEIDQTKLCRGCSGACMWRRSSELRWGPFPAERDIDVGSLVTVTLPGRHLLLGAALLYGLPLVCLLVGALAGGFVLESEAAGVIGALVGLVISLSVAGRLRSSIERAVMQGLMIRPAS